MTLILHCGGKPATFEDICSIPVPPSTATYRGVPHGDITRLVIDRVKKETGLLPTEMQFGLNRDGAQMFGVLKYEDTFAGSNYGMMYGLRNSYDKSLSIGIAHGISVLVCDNLAIHGSRFSVLRKHTGNCWDDVIQMVVRAAMDTEVHTRRMGQWLDALKDTSMDLGRGYEILGLATGQGLLAMNQFSRALQEWRSIETKPEYRHSEFRDTGYALYQAFTEGLKQGAVDRKLDAYCGVSQLFEELHLAPTLDGDVVDAEFERMN